MRKFILAILIPKKVGVLGIEVPGSIRTNSQPTLVEFKDDLWLIVKGTDNKLYANVRYENNKWSGWVEVPGGGRTDSSPKAIIYNGTLRLLVKGMDNYVYINTRDGAIITPNPGPHPNPTPSPAPTWSGWSKYPDGQSPSGPAIAEYNGQLYTMVRGMDDKIYLKTGLGGGWTQIGGATLGSPALEKHQGNLYALVRGTDNGIYLNRLNREVLGVAGPISVALQRRAAHWPHITGNFMRLSEVLITEYMLIK